MRLLALIVLILMPSTNAMAQESRADRVYAASTKACYLDKIRTRSFTDVVLAKEGENQRIESVWLKRFNDFSSTTEAKLLRDYAEELNNLNIGRHRDEQCLNIVPAYGLAVTAIALKFAKGSVVPGHLLERCGDKWCLPRALEVIADTCEVMPSSGRYHRCQDLTDVELSEVLPKKHGTITAVPR